MRPPASPRRRRPLRPACRAGADHAAAHRRVEEGHSPLAGSSGELAGHAGISRAEVDDHRAGPGAVEHAAIAGDRLAQDAGFGRLQRTNAASAAASAGELARARRARNGETASSLGSKTVTAYPAFSRRLVMRPPMRPTPINAMPWFTMSSTGSRGRRGTVAARQSPMGLRQSVCALMVSSKTRRRFRCCRRRSR